MMAVANIVKNESQDLEPTVPQEYILKGVVNAAVGQVIFVMNNIWVVMMTKYPETGLFNK